MAAQRRASDERSKILIASYYDTPPEPAEVFERSVPVEGGEIVVRVYRPHGEGPFPGHLYIHGGGFWLGSLESCDNPCREICVGAGAVVVSVAYRLAPEHPFPTPPEDCYAALLWLHEHADELGVDPRALSVGGESAGGNLAAVVALMARDRSGPSLALQVLGIPVCDLTMSQPSVQEFGEGYLLRRAGMADYADHYLSEPEDAQHPYASPLFAQDLSELPPALVMTMEFDPLRDEGEAYARRLVEAGVPTRHMRWSGHVHGSALFSKLPGSAREYHGIVSAALTDAYARLGEEVAAR
ncbi:alpha/beta hydrolase [Conexibacter sp. CPCC 206217]|uniref:alpha/beta hydrolase n=1 Tax=Conexibacter sp. CPCC 206217 TaxID=3064574 RepID=UPI00271C1FFE|nr:alpha/beta hydrolase [Conexibacter sp. CPCC 206217]MDO8210322.1 alpha/beta hydrolase [Conexibacter sp. CPCC 206217]